MSNGWSSKDVTLSGTDAQTVGASATNTPVSQEFPITAGGACVGFVLKAVFSAVTVGTAITAKLQTAIGSTWVDSKTASVAANGAIYIKILSDNTYMPLLNKGRLVVTTGSGDTATVTSVDVLQAL